MPVADLDGLQRPCDVFDGEALPDVFVLEHIGIVIDVGEATLQDR